MGSSVKTVVELFNNYVPSVEIRVDKVTNPDDPSDEVDVFEELIWIEDIGRCFKIHTASCSFVVSGSLKIIVRESDV